MGQAVTSTFTTDGFGNVVSQWGSSGNPYRFAGGWGYRDDGDAGLLHVGARYDDPQVGRFISRDAALSEHPYLYCEHEPVHSVDPSGDIAVAAGAVVLVPGIGQAIAVGVIAVGATIAVIWLAEQFDKSWDELRREHKEQKKHWRYGTQQPLPPPFDPRHEPPDPKGPKDWIALVAKVLAELFENIFQPKVLIAVPKLDACGEGYTTQSWAGAY
ncbi:MAG: hypothetical protein C4335_11785 [Armatimonadota bacterium]